MANEQTDYDFLLAAGAENSRYKRMMEQQKAQADLMRQNSQLGNGQMVSGHYVAPSWTQGLNSLMNAVGSKYMDNKALDSGGKLDESMKGQSQKVLEALLRNRASTQRPPAQQPMQQGPMDQTTMSMVQPQIDPGQQMWQQPQMPIYPQDPYYNPNEA